jgi:hypothetical protein
MESSCAPVRGIQRAQNNDYVSKWKKIESFLFVISFVLIYFLASETAWLAGPVA